MQMDKFIELKNVTFSYITEYDDETVKTTALKSISLEINRGEFVAVKPGGPTPSYL